MKSVICQNPSTNLDYWEIPKESNKELLKLADPHIDAFNFALESLEDAVRSLPIIEFEIPSGAKIGLSMENAEIDKPKIEDTFLNNAANLNLFPRECIERSSTYSAPFAANLIWWKNGIMQSVTRLNLGNVPIMVKSKKCHLHNLSPKELVNKGELEGETGGYFIINGICKILRMFVGNRRNFPIALVRPTWKKRNTNYSDKGILMRCVASDQTSSEVVLHYLISGEADFSFRIEKEFFFLPLIMCLKILVGYSAELIYSSLIRGLEHDDYFSEKIQMMMWELQEKSLYTQDDCKSYVGNLFRVKLSNDLHKSTPDSVVCDYIFEKYVLIHLDTPKQKFETLCMMARKLFVYVSGKCLPESVDCVSMQEVHLGGHTYLQVIKRKMLDVLLRVKMKLLMSCEKGTKLSDSEIGRIIAKSCSSVKVGDAVSSFISTGTLPGNITCGLMQTKGLSVILEHLNRLRDLSHLRSIHRGSFFVDMKNIEPRRLTGAAWGFICPLHTPDGILCGLLNHLSSHCVISSQKVDRQMLKNFLLALGVFPCDTQPMKPYKECLEVILDGCLIGYVMKKSARNLTATLRAFKVTGRINQCTELVLVEAEDQLGQYPGLFIITSEARMMRPVVNLHVGGIEYVGTFEQLYLDIAIHTDQIEKWVHTHVEIDKTFMLSNVAKLVPFADCNPSPRNMYQCQMGKQTMGTPVHNWRSQTNSKLYRLTYPQLGIVRNSHYDKIDMPQFCMGFNAIVAVISYTGYDMEDAMVINKAAMERGLAHGQVYKSETIDLNCGGGRYKNKISDQIFERDPTNATLECFLDAYGLPYPGSKLNEGDPYYCVFDLNKKTYKIEKYKGEPCIIDKYSIISKATQSGKDFPGIQKVNITIRIRRNPIVGDKFCSRSGQKGIMSRLYPIEDLPFSGGGIMPDIIFNPHGIPSRMTAGMLIEILAGKCGAEFGINFDSTPFEFDDENPAYEYFEKFLEKAGFNYFGEDILYSGTDGREIEVKIFEGVLYYQRLRHMTADKAQVRSTGPMNYATLQPTKGRNKGGAIRFGEMERDCLIAHGAPYLLQDRLLNCSDSSKEWICSNCGSILSTTLKSDTFSRKAVSTTSKSDTFSKKAVCVSCGPTNAKTAVRQVTIPYALKYLIAELSSVNIKIEFNLSGSERMVESSSINKDEKPP